MACPDLYLGPDRADAPPTPVWTNPAIEPPSDVLMEGSAVTINVTARNHGTGDANGTLYELFWSDPTTGFLALPARQIGVISGDVPSATVTPPLDGHLTFGFAWMPDSNAAGTNGGHVCLLARLSCDNPGTGCPSQIYNGANPAADPLSAIHNIHVNMAPKPSPSPGPGGAGGPGQGGRRFAFAFGATNPFHVPLGTRLVAHALDPVANRGRLQSLLLHNRVHDFALRGTKFRAPAEVNLSLGVERVVVPARFLKSKALPPRLGTTGPLHPEMIAHLRAAKNNSHEIAVDLLPLESRQTIVELTVEGTDGELFAVDILHETNEPKPRVLGGLTVMYGIRRSFC